MIQNRLKVKKCVKKIISRNIRLFVDLAEVEKVAFADPAPRFSQDILHSASFVEREVD